MIKRLKGACYMTAIVGRNSVVSQGLALAWGHAPRKMGENRISARKDFNRPDDVR